MSQSKPNNLREPKLTAMGASETRRWILFSALVTGLAVVVAYFLFFTGRQGVYWDAKGYYDLGAQIATGGFASFSSEKRTYGYPLFVALGWILSDHDPSTVRFLVFNLQLIVFLSTCFYATRYINTLFKNSGFALAFFALSALNPVFLIYTTELLSDLLSALLVFLAVVFSVQLPVQGIDERLASTRRTTIWAFLSGLVAGLACVVRPANVSILGAIAVIWIVRGVAFKGMSWRAWMSGILGVIIPFLPQLFFNYRAFGLVEPLIVSNLYSFQTEVGIKLLKYGALLVPGYEGGVVYLNPFVPSEISTLADFATSKPVGFLLTSGLHLFSIFDQGLAFPYIVDLHPWYRWPLSIAFFLFLFISIMGVLSWAKEILKRRSLSRRDFFFMGMLVAGLAYVVVYLPTAVESRFGLPEYLLLGSFCIVGLGQLRLWSRARKGKILASTLLTATAFLVLTTSVSAWIERQAQAFDSQASPYASYSVIAGPINARLGDRLELRDYVLKTPRIPQGGDLAFLILNWRCGGLSTDQYDIQVELFDSRGHPWSRARGPQEDPISPCPSRFWEPRKEEGEVLTLELFPAMPPGEYRITVSVYDRKAEHYLQATTPSSTETASSATIASLQVAKNKSSMSATELPIEQRFFVDMNEVRFLGFVLPPKITRPGELLPVAVYWRARAKPQGDYFVSMQLRDSDGHTVVEETSRPAGEQYPTTLWSAGEVLLDWHDVPIPPSLPVGDYQIVTILRDANGNTLGQAPVSSVSVIQ